MSGLTTQWRFFQTISSSAFEPIAPRLWAYEIRNSILIALRRGRITRTDGDELLSSLNELNLHFREPSSYNDVFSLAAQQSLTVYDAAYLALALQESVPLASLDRQLVRA